MKQEIGIRLLGTGSCVPSQVVTNADMEGIVETSDEWIRTRTGIEQRHIADGETNLALTKTAAERAMAMAGIDPKEIGVVICATMTGETMVPSLACLLQRECGLSEHVFAFDMSAACTGFLYALHTARALLCAMPEKKYALVTGSELLSRITDFSDRNTCVLFGDGAGAAVLELDENTAYYFDGGAKGDDQVLYCPRNYTLPNPFSHADAEPKQQKVSMEGRAVYTFAVQALTGSILRTAEQAGGLPDKYICHQANARIIQTAAKQLKEPMEKFFMNIDHCGNTSAASIPIALDECVRSGGIQRGETVMLSGFGGGLAYGTAFFTF